MKYWSSIALPTAARLPNNGIHRVVLEMHSALADEFEPVTSPSEADLLIVHASDPLPNVNKAVLAVCHGLYTAPIPALYESGVYQEINRRVLLNITSAHHVLAPSQWVADVIERETLARPQVVTWGIHPHAWQGGKGGDYVLWNKNRPDPVCNPVHMNTVATRLPHLKFKSTFGQAATNVEILGRQPHEVMRKLIMNAGVYLATTKETGDIGSKEALAAGVPVVGFNQGALAEFLPHGAVGALVPVGDYEALAEAIEWAFAHRATLSKQAQEFATSLAWGDRYPAMLDAAWAAIKNHEALSQFDTTVVIPCYNYGEFVGGAVKSAYQASQAHAIEVIVVDDASPDDDTQRALESLKAEHPAIRIVRQPANAGVAKARNAGLGFVRSRYVIFLDADDELAPRALDLMIDALDSDPALGVAYGRLKIMGGDVQAWPPATFAYERQIRGDNQIPTCAMMRTGDVKRIGGYDATMTPAEDADLFTRLISHTPRYPRRVTDEATLIYRLHPNSLSDSVRRGQKPDPFRSKDYALYKSRYRPLSAPAHPQITIPREYDQPALAIEIIGDKEAGRVTEHDLSLQSFWNYRLGGQAPLILRIEAGKRVSDLSPLMRGPWPDDDGKTFREVMKMACCGGKVKNMGAQAQAGDFVTVLSLGDHAGKISMLSPTQKRNPETGRMLEYRYRGGETLLMHRDDFEARAGDFRLVETPAMLQAEPPSAAPLPDEPIALSEVDSPPAPSPALRKPRKGA
jgi:hypothetical protein